MSYIFINSCADYWYLPIQQFIEDHADVFQDKATHPILRQLLPVQEQEFETLMKKVSNTVIADNLRARLTVTQELAHNNWNCDLIRYRNGSITYEWCEQPTNKIMMGSDTEVLQAYNVAGRFPRGHWDNEDGWTAARDMNIGNLRLRDIPQDESDQSDSSFPTVRRRLNFN